MKVFVAVGDDGRVGSYTTDEASSSGMMEVDAPDGFDPTTSVPGDYVARGGAIVYDPLPEPEPPVDPVEVAQEAMEAASEAKEIASQAGTDPQVQTIARLAMPSIDFASVTATDVVAIPDYVPEWSTLIGQKLKKNSPCKYKGTIYRASQDVTVQDIYPPDVAGESQYYPIVVASDGIIVYRPCHGEYDMVRAGETRHYPDAEGPVYRAKVDTAYDPDTVPDNWELAQG